MKQHHLFLLVTGSLSTILARSSGSATCFVKARLPLRLSQTIFDSSRIRARATAEDSAGQFDTDFPGGRSSSFRGAGLPRLELSPEDIPPLLMEALQNNDVPDIDSGLQSMWEFAGGNTHFIFEQNVTDFIESAHETAHEFPTSFYGAAMYGQSWNIETELNRVGGPDGWIATQVMRTISSDGRLRRWQWELRRNRRPPGMGIWLVESIGSSDRKGNFEAEED